MHYLLPLRAAAALSFLFLSSFVRSQVTPLAGDVWTAPTAPLTSRIISDVTMKGTEYWACGESGIFKSTNLSTWTQVATTGMQDAFTTMRWNGTRFIGAGVGIWTSPDGAAWTLRSNTFPYTPAAMAVRGDIVVAAGALGMITRSGDGGLTWTRQMSGVEVQLTGVAATASAFIIVGDSGAVLTSPDGLEWTLRNSNTDQYLGDVTVAGSTVVAVGDNATIGTSVNNGQTWTTYSIPGGAGVHFNGVSGNNNSTVICGPPSIMVYTTNPANPNAGQVVQLLQSYVPIRRVVRGSSGWACTGACGTLLTSTNGTSWTLRSPNAGNYYLSTVRTSSHFLAAGAPGDKISRSTDGVTWTYTNSNMSASEPQGVTALVWAPSPAKLVAGTAGGKLLSSTASDGSGLAERTSPVTTRFNGGCWTGSQFIMVAESGVLLTSSNGNNWTVRSSGRTESLLGAGSNGTRHVVCGGLIGQNSQYGFILSSTDGIGWSQAMATDWPMSSVAWNGSLFVAVGFSGTIFTSPDGLTWTQRSIDGGESPWEGIMTAVTWAGTNWIAVASGGDVVLSTDGIAWKVQRFAGPSTLFGLCYGAGKAVAVGEGGVVLTSVAVPASKPVIKVPPMKQEVLPGVGSAIGVIAQGTPTMRYEWRRDGVVLPDETRVAYGFTEATALDSGMYEVVITNDAGSVTSPPVEIRVKAHPEIVEGNSGMVSAAPGGTAGIVVQAAGAGPITYQWFKSGTSALAGKTAATLTFTNVTASDAGNYYLEATNEYGAVSTGIWTLAVTPPLAEALDLPAATLIYAGGTAGGQAWNGSLTDHHDGSDAAASGTTPDLGTSWMEFTVSDVSSVSFWWNVSSEAGFDHLSFYVDGQVRDSISGAAAWAPKTFPLSPAAPHVLRWSYVKDGSSSAGADKAWVDQVTFTPSPAIDFPLWASAVNLPAARRGAHDTNGPLLIDNTLAYALGINPLTATPAALPVLTVNGNTLLYGYTRTLRVPGISYHVEWATNSTAAVWSTEGVNDFLTGTSATQETRTATLTLPPNTPRAFVRLRVSLSGE